VDLIDGAKLLELVREHLPGRAENLEAYRGFDLVASRHVRAMREPEST
jgi:hypothetical protein